MSNLTLALDDELLASARRYAQEHGTTVNALVRKALEQTVRPDATGWFDDLERLMDASGGTSQGRRWTRDELHDRAPATRRTRGRKGRR